MILRHHHRNLFILLVIFTLTILYINYKNPNSHRDLLKILPTFKIKISEKIKDENKDDLYCTSWLIENAPEIDALILDIEFLNAIPESLCNEVAKNRKIKVF